MNTAHVEGHRTPEDTTPALAVSNGELLLWGVIATVTMLFAGLASAYLVRRSGTDWSPIAMPGILWLNTALLVASSFTMEVARGDDSRGRLNGARLWLALTGVLGLAFVAGQLAGWQQLVAMGVYLPTNPHSSFFYILTGLHGLHLLGGVVFMTHAFGRLWRARAAPLRLCAMYWHFMGGVWLFLVYLLFGV